MAERRRRKKHNDRLYMLRSVVPKISKHWEHLCDCTSNNLRLFYRYTLAELNDMLHTFDKPDSKEEAIYVEKAVAFAKKMVYSWSIDSNQAFTLIGKEEGLKGYWKENLPQVIRVIPYSAAQPFSYETYKKLFSGKDWELIVIGRLAEGACAGMTSTFVTYPLDVLRLRLAVEPAYKTMTEVSLNMIREEGFASFYNGLGPSLIGIASYIAVNFCVFDLVKKALPDKYQKRTEISLATVDFGLS